MLDMKREKKNKYFKNYYSRRKIIFTRLINRAEELEMFLLINKFSNLIKMQSNK